MIPIHWILLFLLVEIRPLNTSPFFDKSLMALQMAKKVAAPGAPDLTCTDENKTYVVNVKIHSQDDVVKAIHSVALGSGEVDEPDAIMSYFSSIFDSLNRYMMRFKVQVHLDLNGYNSDDFMGSFAFDKSCEKNSPVIERTSSAFAFLEKDFKDDIGLHLFLWSCPYIADSFELRGVKQSEKCGRAIGVMWRGTKETKFLIMNAIIHALSGIFQGYGLGNPAYDLSVMPGLCKYVTICLGMQKTEIGQIVYGTEIIKYTDIGNTDFCWDCDED